MNIKQAFAYPLQAGNRMRLLVMPNVLTIGAMMSFTVPCIVIAISAPAIAEAGGFIDGLSPAMLLPLIGLLLVGFVVMLVAMMPLYGYYWTLIDRWQTEGLEAQAPQWKGQWKTYFKTGCHTFLISLVMMIPSLLVILSLGLLAPFFYAPFFLAAKERTVGSYFRNLGAGCALAKNRYAPVLGAMYLSLGIMIVYSVVNQILAITIIVPLALTLLSPALSVVCMHLLTQQFGLGEGGDEHFHGKGPSGPGSATVKAPDYSPSFTQEPVSPAEQQPAAMGSNNLMVFPQSATVQMNTMAPQLEDKSPLLMEETLLMGGNLTSNDTPGGTVIPLEVQDALNRGKSEKPAKKAKGSAKNITVAPDNNPWLRHRH